MVFDLKKQTEEAASKVMLNKKWDLSEKMNAALDRCAPKKTVVYFCISKMGTLNEDNFLLAWVGVKWKRDLTSSASQHRHLIL